MNWRRFLVVVFTLLVSVGMGASRVSAQASISTGSIQGTVTDAQGAVVPSAKVTILNNGTGQKISPPLNGAGIFNSGPVEPGSYTIHVESAGFKTTDVGVVVQVGNIASETVVLQVGSGSTTVTVEATTETVNPDQVTIQGVVTQEQIENLPINGRNFLDLAQLEPGVQIQDGGNFDPTKKGFESVSFGGRFGRTARIEVDGFDISDETVGTTTQNISMNSIQEFQVAQSSLDLGTELTSSGTINVTTKSGTNSIHGDGFYGYRDNGTSANIGTFPNQSIFTRKQYGADLGAPIIKDKLFAFGSWERTTQTENAAVQPVAPFQDLNGTVGSPFNDLEFLGRIDYNVSKSAHVFFKYAYEQNRDVASFIPGTYEPFANVDNTPSYGGGLDFITGSFTHSIRIGYLKFRNGIAAAPVDDPRLNPAPGISLAVGNGPTSCTAGGNLFCSGLNILAPQSTFQSDKQFKYSGSHIIGTHTLVYGAGVNRILGGGLANFFGLGPALKASRRDLTQSLREGGASGDSRAKHRAHNALVVAEVALSLMVLIASGLLLNSFWRLIHVHPGFDTANVTTAEVSLVYEKYRDSDAARAAFFDRLREHIAAQPGVDSVGFISELPLSGQANDTFFTVQENPPADPDDRNDADIRVVSGDYFRAMRIPLLAGRSFTTQDAPNSPRVALVNRPFAVRYFGNDNPIGKHLHIWEGGKGFTAREIVGIVGGNKHFVMQETPRAEMFVPQAQSQDARMNLVIRSVSEPAVLASEVRAAVSAIDPDEAPSSFRSMSDVISASEAGDRFNTILIVLFGAIALLLAAAGIFGVLSYLVTQRTREIGLRVALGAQPQNVLRVIVGHGMRLALIGVAIGLVGALAATRWMSSFLFDVKPTDPITFAAVVFILTLVAFLACYFPARRAMRVDPMVALRYE